MTAHAWEWRNQVGMGCVSSSWRHPGPRQRRAQRGPHAEPVPRPPPCPSPEVRNEDGARGAERRHRDIRTSDPESRLCARRLGKGVVGHGTHPLLAIPQRRCKVGRNRETGQGVSSAGAGWARATACEGTVSSTTSSPDDSEGGALLTDPGGWIGGMATREAGARTHGRQHTSPSPQTRI